MKTPKNQSIALFLLFLIYCCACQDNPSDDIGEKKEFKLSMDGDLVDFTESTLGRTNDEKTLYAVFVYSSSDNISELPYAYGIFENPENMSIGLYDNRDYQFYVDVYRKGTAYGLATYQRDDKTKMEAPYWDFFLNNQFEFSTTFDYYRHDGANYWIDADSTQSKYSWSAPEVDVYRGDLFVTVDDLDDEEITIQTERTVFGIEANVENCTSGKVVISLGSDDQVFELTPEDPKLPMKIFSLNAHHSSSFDFTYLPLNIAHVTESGMNVIYNQEVKFNRMKIKQLNITLCDDCNAQSDGKVNVILDDADWETESIDING